MNKDFILTTDASGGALAFILEQKDENNREYVVSYGGRAIRPEEKNWNISELECLAVIVGIDTFKHYLSHRHFTVRTDHQALTSLTDKKEPAGRLARWAIKLQAYNYKVEHRAGSKIQNADAISRIDYSRMPVNTLDQDIEFDSNHLDSLFNPNDPASDQTQLSETNLNEKQTSLESNSQQNNQSTKEYTEITFEYSETPEVNNVETVADLHEIARLQRECEDFKHYVNYLGSQIVPEDKDLATLVTVTAENQFLLKDGVLYHVLTPRTQKVKDRNPDSLILQVALPKSERKAVLNAYHDCKAGGGHFGVKRTFAAIKQKYWWPNMYQAVSDYVETCDVCQRVKVVRNRYPVPLTPLPVEDVFSRIHIDILCSLPKTKEGYQYILLIVDSFSKWSEAFPLKTQEAKEIAHLLYNEIFTRYGAPRALVSDRGQNFLSKLVGALLELFDVKHYKTSRYHPETNATVERANSTLAQTLRAFISKDQQRWPSLLPSVMMAFRSTPCTETTGFSPYQLVFGREMNLPIDTSLVPKRSLPADVQQHMQQLLECLKLYRTCATGNMTSAQQQAKIRHDVRAKEPGFKVGDKILLKKEKIPQGQSAKLCDKSEGPFVIVEAGPNFTYKLRDCQTNKLTRTFINARELRLYRERQPEIDETHNAHQPVDLPQPDALPQPVDLPQPVAPQPVDLPQPDAPPQPVALPHPEPPKPINKHDGNQMDNSNHESEDPNDQAPIKKDMSNVRVIQAKRKGGKQRYRLEWPDGSRAWESESNVPKQAINVYLKTHTKNGRKRKRKFFIQPKP